MVEIKWLKKTKMYKEGKKDNNYNILLPGH